MGGVVVGLADGADETFVATVGVDADEVEDLSFVEVSFGAFEVPYFYFF